MLLVYGRVTFLSRVRSANFYAEKMFKRGTCQRGTSVFDLGVGSALRARLRFTQRRKDAEGAEKRFTLPVVSLGDMLH